MRVIVLLFCLLSFTACKKREVKTETKNKAIPQESLNPRFSFQEYGLKEKSKIKKETTKKVIPQEFHYPRSSFHNCRSHENEFAETDSLFHSITTASEAYSILKQKRELYYKKGELSKLFNSFSLSKPFFNSDSTTIGPSDSLAKEWIRDGLLESNEEVRHLYFRYQHLLGIKGGYHFKTWYHHLYPHDTRWLYADYVGADTSGADSSFYTVELAKLNDSKLFQPFGNLKGTLSGLKDSIPLSFKETGIFRVTVFNETFFMPFYFKVGYLQTIIKHPKDMILIWSSSYKDIVPPPYKVTVSNSGGTTLQFESDSSGIVEIEGNTYEKLKEDSLSILTVTVEKGNEKQIIRDTLQPVAQDTLLGVFITSDRVVYEKGDTIFLSGMAKAIPFVEHPLDSLIIEIQNTSTNKNFRRKVALDSWGHFAFTITENEYLDEGSYKLVAFNFVGSMRVDWRPKCAFTIEAPRKKERKIVLTTDRILYRAGESVVVKSSVENNYKSEKTISAKVTWYGSPVWLNRNDWAKHGKSGFCDINHSTNPISEQTVKIPSSQKGSFTFQIPNNDTAKIYWAEVDDGEKIFCTPKIISDTCSYYLLNTSWTPFGEDSSLIALHYLEYSGTTSTLPWHCKVTFDSACVVDTTFTLDGKIPKNIWFESTKKGDYQIELLGQSSSGESISRQMVHRVSNKACTTLSKDHFQLGIGRTSSRDSFYMVTSINSDTTTVMQSIETEREFHYSLKKLSSYSQKHAIPIDRAKGHHPFYYIGGTGSRGLIKFPYHISVIDKNNLLKSTLSVRKKGNNILGKVVVTDKNGTPMQTQMSVTVTSVKAFEKDWWRSCMVKSKKSTLHYHLHRNAIQSLFPHRYSSPIQTIYEDFSHLKLGNYTQIDKLFMWDYENYARKLYSIMREAQNGKASSRIGFAMGNSHFGDVSDSLTSKHEESPIDSLLYYEHAIKSNSKGVAKFRFPISQTQGDILVTVTGSDKGLGLFESLIYVDRDSL